MANDVSAAGPNRSDKRPYQVSLLSIPLALFVGVSSAVARFSDPTPPDGAFLTAFAKLAPIDGIAISNFIYCFLFVHVLRMTLGVLFLDYDVSLNNAICEAEKSSKKRVCTWLVVIPLTFTSPLLLLFEIRWFIMLILYSHILALFVFHSLYWDELYRRDTQKAANIFIGLADALYIAFVAMILSFHTDGSEMPPGVASWAVAGFAAYLLVFFGECVSQYFPVTRYVFAVMFSWDKPSHRGGIPSGSHNP